MVEKEAILYDFSIKKQNKTNTKQTKTNKQTNKQLCFMEQKSQNIVLFNNSRYIAYLKFKAIFEFLWLFTIRYNISQKGVDNF